MIFIIQPATGVLPRTKSYPVQTMGFEHECHWSAQLLVFSWLVVLCFHLNGPSEVGLRSDGEGSVEEAPDRNGTNNGRKRNPE